MVPLAFPSIIFGESRGYRVRTHGELSEPRHLSSSPFLFSVLWLKWDVMAVVFVSLGTKAAALKGSNELLRIVLPSSLVFHQPSTVLSCPPSVDVNRVVFVALRLSFTS